jgi:broad specificity phosphatase PhoE
MNKLILVKHSLPEIEPGQNPHEWQLGEEGRKRSKALAGLLAAYAPQAIISSLEPKAHQTAEIVARQLRLPIETLPGLEEHARRQEPFEDKQCFQEKVAELFAHPEERVYGEETAEEARGRFMRAAESALSAHPHQTIAIIAHGTVISLFVARIARIDPYPLWQRLGLPSFVVLSRPELALLEVKEAAYEG